MAGKKKGKYWVNVTLVEVLGTGEEFKYGAEFPDLKDEARMEKLLKLGIISLKKPSDSPEPILEEKPSVLAPSMSQEEAEKLKEQSTTGEK